MLWILWLFSPFLWTQILGRISTNSVLSTLRICSEWAGITILTKQAGPHTINKSGWIYFMACLYLPYLARTDNKNRVKVSQVLKKKLRYSLKSDTKLKLNSFIHVI